MLNFPSLSLFQSASNADVERQPLLPSSSTSNTAANVPSGTPRDRPSGNVQALIDSYGRRSVRGLNGGLNTQLLSRTAGKLSKGVGRIAWQSGEAIATSAATAWLTRAVLGRLFGNGDTELDQPLIDRVAAVTKNIVTKLYGNESLGKEDMVMLALVAAATAYQSQTGLQLALASQLSSSIGKSVSDLTTLIKTVLPTRREDYQLVFEELQKQSKEFQEQHPELKESFSILDTRIAERLRYIEDKDHRGFDALFNLFKARHLLGNPPNPRDVNNLFHHEHHGDLHEAFRYNRIQSNLVAQVPKESRTAVDTFIRRLRAATRPDWRPSARNDGTSDMNAILFVGKPGTGKTYMADRIVEQFGLNAVRMSLPQFVKRLSGEASMPDQSSAPHDTRSPEAQLGPIYELLGKGLTAPLIFEEVDLADEKQANVLKALFDPARFGIFEIAGEPEGVVYRLDLRRTPIILTSNIVPTDPAIVRRIPMAIFDRVSDEVRQRAAQTTFEACVNGLQSLRLTDEQRTAIETRMSGLLESIRAEGEADPGPAIMQAVITDVFNHVTQPFLEEAGAGESETTGIGLEGAGSSTEAGADAAIGAYIRDCFKQRREYDAVQNAVDEAIDSHAERGLSFNDLEEIANQRKFGARETIEFLRKAVEGMWKDAAQQKNEEIQTSLRTILESVDIEKGSIKPSDEKTDKFNSCRSHLAFYHLLMTMPSTSRNLSHWEAGGDTAKRKEMQVIKQRIVRNTPGEKNKTEIAEFIDRLYDNSLPGSEVKDRAVMTLWGPPGTGKTYLATSIFEQLGLPYVELEAYKLTSLFEGDFNIGGGSKTTPKELLGPLFPLFSGEQYGGGILVDEVTIKEDKLEDFKRFFDPERKHVKIKYAGLENVFLSLPIGEIPIIMTSNAEITDPALLRRMKQLHIASSEPAIRKKVALEEFNRQVTLLSAFDLSPESKATITQAAASAMNYVIEDNSENDPGPALLKPVIASLFRHLRAPYLRSELETEVNFPEEDVSVEVPWERLASTDEISQELKELVDGFFASRRPAKEESDA